MKRMRVVFFVLLIMSLFTSPAALISAGAQDAAEQDAASINMLEIRQPSIVQLIAFPFRWDAARIRVVGHVRIHSEAQAVYLAESDAKYEITKNGLWLELNDELKNNKEIYEGKVCLLEGTFNSRSNGPEGLWSGVLENIKKVAVVDEKKRSAKPAITEKVKASPQEVSEIKETVAEDVPVAEIEVWSEEEAAPLDEEKGEEAKTVPTALE